MRVATECQDIIRIEQDRLFCSDVFAACHNAFVNNYIKPELNYMAIQTLDNNENVVQVIPKTLYANSGYHTELSMIEADQIKWENQ